MAMAVGGVGGLIGSLVATRLGAAFGAVRVVIAARAASSSSLSLSRVPVPNRADRRRNCTAKMITIPNPGVS
jgi:hypothetical protein